MKYIIIVQENALEDQRMIVCDDHLSRVKKTQEALYGKCWRKMTWAEREEWGDNSKHLAAGSKVDFTGRLVSWLDVETIIFSCTNAKSAGTDASEKTP